MRKTSLCRRCIHMRYEGSEMRCALGRAEEGCKAFGPRPVKNSLRCNQCPERKTGCSDTCEDYAAYHEELERRAHERAEGGDAKRMLAEGAQRRAKGWR